MLHGRYAKAVRSLFGLEATQVGILPELIPTVEVMRADGSTAFARGEHIYAVQVDRAAIAGNHGIIVFRNPADSNKLGVFELIEIWSDAGAIIGRIRMERGGTAAANAVAVSARDPRIWSDVPPYPIPNSIEVSEGGVAAQPGHRLWNGITTAANLKDVFVHPIVLVPGTTLYIVGTPQNQNFAVNVCWWERVVDAAEYG